LTLRITVSLLQPLSTYIWQALVVCKQNMPPTSSQVANYDYPVT